MMMDSSVWKN